MDKFFKIFDVAFTVAFALFAVLILIYPVGYLNYLTYHEYEFVRACGLLFSFVVRGIRSFFKTKPFYVRRKAKWPEPCYGLACIASGISITARDLTGSSTLGWMFFILAIVLFLASSKRTKKTRNIRKISKADLKY